MDNNQIMSYPMTNLNGGIHPCYLYMQEIKRCFREQLYPQTDCKKEKQDFNECHSGQKLAKLMSQADAAMRKTTIINVPHYDRENDRFVFDDGKIIQNDDPVFKKYDWA